MISSTIEYEKISSGNFNPDNEYLLNDIKELRNRPNVISPSIDELKAMAEKYGTKTQFGNINFVSSVKNRSAGLTVYSGSSRVAQKRLNQKQKEILEKLPKTMKLVHEYLKKAPLICVDRTMGDNQYFTPNCTFYVSYERPEMSRLAYMVSKTLFEPKKNNNPNLFLIHIPEWQEKDRQILIFPEMGNASLTYVLGTDYYGEDKKGFLRMAMWHSKLRGMLGLHAGSKIVRAKDKTGRIKTYNMLFFGLSATGKTTHVCHDHNLDQEGENIEVVQDDVVFLRSDSSVLGTERGFYLKTGYLEPKIQPMIYKAATSPDAIFENVLIGHGGIAYFDDETLTGNGRGIMQRQDFGTQKARSINLKPANEVDGLIIIFITRRNTITPLVSKLNLEQAAAAFMLGESIESSAGDPTRAGESVREVGTNPFIIGDEAYEGNWFYHFLLQNKNKVHCYLLNTGGVGEIDEKKQEGHRIIKQEVVRPFISGSAAIIRGILRDTIEWENEPYFNTTMAKKVDGIDMKKFDLSNYYTEEQIDFYVRVLKIERMSWMSQFQGLDERIVNFQK